MKEDLRIEPKYIVATSWRCGTCFVSKDLYFWSKDACIRLT
jgi:hypothetical protein